MLADELESSKAAGAKTEKKVGRQKGLVLEAEKSKKHVLNNVGNSRDRVEAAGTHEAELLFNV